MGTVLEAELKRPYMIQIHVTYEGDLRCKVIHGPSGRTLMTDAPKDNHGRGETFSPTDMMAVALGSCIATVMGIVAKRHEIDLKGTKVSVVKEMTTEGVRRIKKLGATVTLSDRLTPDQRALLEKTALSCPDHKSLHPDIDAPVYFIYQ